MLRIVFTLKNPMASANLGTKGQHATSRPLKPLYRVLVGKPEGKRDHMGDSGVDERVLLRWIFRKWDVRVWTGSSWLRIGTGGGHL